MRRLRSLVLFVVVAVAPLRAWAWTNHFLVTGPALANLPKVTGAGGVRVEALERFLSLNESGVASLLVEEQRWAEGHVPNWPALPAQLVFSPGCDHETLRLRFLYAMRVSPASNQSLFLQLMPGAKVAPDRAAQAESDVMPAGIIHEPSRRFERIVEGDTVAPLAVVATASDEPDYGFDYDLFSDDSGDFGKRDGLGKQPFGNSAISFGTQAPFHIGYYHEPSTVTAAAPYLKRSFPEQRIHLYLALARYAFGTQHDYWGWRFLGWALHYIEDLAQPYHARVLPGVGTARLLWDGVLGAVGIKGPKSNLIILSTNQHLELEDFEERALHAELAAGDLNGPLLAALADASGDGASPAWSDSYPREVLTVRSAALCDELAARMKATFPARYIDDPAYSYSVTEPSVDMWKLLEGAPDRRNQLVAEVAVLLKQAGIYVRTAIASVR